MEAYMYTSPGITIGSPTKFMCIRIEGHFEETGLFYCFAVDLPLKNARVIADLILRTVRHNLINSNAFCLTNTNF